MVSAINGTNVALINKKRQQCMKYIEWQKTDTTHIINAVDNLGCFNQALLFIIVFFYHPGQDGLYLKHTRWCCYTLQTIPVIKSSLNNAQFSNMVTYRSCSTTCDVHKSMLLISLSQELMDCTSLSFFDSKEYKQTKKR